MDMFSFISVNQGRIIKILADANAFSPDTALSYYELQNKLHFNSENMLHVNSLKETAISRILDTLINSGQVHRVFLSYYLDYAKYRKGRKFIAISFAAFILILFILHFRSLFF